MNVIKNCVIMQINLNISKLRSNKCTCIKIISLGRLIMGPSVKSTIVASCRRGVQGG